MEIDRLVAVARAVMISLCTGSYLSAFSSESAQSCLVLPVKKSERMWFCVEFIYHLIILSYCLNSYNNFLSGSSVGESCHFVSS